MNIYVISQDSNTGYDTYDSAVVVAESADTARLLHPGGWVWDTDRKCWVCENDVSSGDRKWWDPPDRSGWCHPDNVTVEHVGTAREGQQPGVICASFNAG